MSVFREKKYIQNRSLPPFSLWCRMSSGSDFEMRPAIPRMRFILIRKNQNLKFFMLTLGNLWMILHKKCYIGGSLGIPAALPSAFFHHFLPNDFFPLFFSLSLFLSLSISQCLLLLSTFSIFLNSTTLTYDLLTTTNPRWNGRNDRNRLYPWLP